MIRPSAAAVVYLCVGVTDMRKQAASLALLVEQGLKRDVFAPALYVFSNARRDRIRILYWECNGLVLWSKRLERQRFIWPQVTDCDTVSMSGSDLNRLLEEAAALEHLWAEPRALKCGGGPSRVIQRDRSEPGHCRGRGPGA